MAEEQLMTDFELITACLNGNQNSFGVLLNRYKNLVYSVVLRMVNDREEANDLAQEVFIKMYKNLDKYYPDYKFATWVIRIATNHVIDYRRKKKQETVCLDEIEYEPLISREDGPETTFLKKEQAQMLQNLIDKLPSMYKVPIVLYHQQGLSYQEISDIIEEPLSKVKNRIFRGRKMLKESLSNVL